MKYFLKSVASACEGLTRCAALKKPPERNWTQVGTDPNVRLRSFLSLPVFRVGVWSLLLLAATLACADLPDWIQNLDGSNPVRGALLKLVTMPGGLVFTRKPPRESRPALTEMIGREPRNAELVAVRARTDEEGMDFAAAEIDWKRYSDMASDRAAGLLALADFYHRRLRPLDEVRILSEAAQQPLSKWDAMLPASQQAPWRAFERIRLVIEEQALPMSAGIANYRAWITRYPREQSLYRTFFDYLIAEKEYVPAQELLAAYQKAFPNEGVFPIAARASIERAQGSPAKALETYDRAFEPLWPPELVKSYFDLLAETHHLRDYLSKAHTAIAANPGDINAAARLFYYYQQQGNLPAAQHPLLEYSQRKDSGRAAWTANELWVLGQLFEGAQNHAEAARFYYALYSLPGADAASAERALGALYNLLMGAPEQAVAFGSDDLSFYKDVATMDRDPGFLNGILSLILNTTYPAQQYSNEQTAAVAYFHRGAAAQLLALFERRFPKSPERPAMEARLIDAYATYGDNDAIIQAGRKFLASFPGNSYRVSVAMQMADAFARKNDVKNEFATYDALLKELSAQAGGVPLGPGVQATARVMPPQAIGEEAGNLNQPGAIYRAQRRFATPIRGGMPAAQPVRGARSPEYSRVLERYIARLVSLKRPMDAIALYRQEIDRNPDDPGLYERFAQFLEQNQLAADVEQVYKRAIQQFQQPSWYHKLARWYLRQQQRSAFDQITRQIVKIFSGSDLESYFRDVVGMGNVDAQLYRQLNEFAHQRFPSNLAFVRNLMNAYLNPQTADMAAYLALLRNYWYWDDNIRARFFEQLSSSGQLSRDLGAVRVAAPGALAGQWKQAVAANPAAVRFIAEANAWTSHFEAAADPMRAIHDEFPADLAIGQRTASIERSLAGYEADFEPSGAQSAALAAAHTAAAVQVEETLSRAHPRDSHLLTFAGETYADRDVFARARPFWDRIPAISPGNRGGYIEAATIFWDYFQYDDALRLIGEARKKFNEPALYAYEAGAIYENKRQYERAVDEYVKGALECGGPPRQSATAQAESAGCASASPARSRLLRLARLSRPALRAAVDKATSVTAFEQSDQPAIDLRVAVLEAENRRADLEAFLLTAADKSASLDVLAYIGSVAARLGMDQVQVRSYERQVAVTTDPVERMRVRLALARFYESKNNITAARTEIETLYKENPNSLGIVRAAVDFYWRNKMPQPAVDTLLDAASRAYPRLKNQLIFEAARKDTEAARYAQARQLLDSLLKQEPFDAQYLAAMADTFAAEKNDTALRDFYKASIQSFGQAPMTPAERTERIATLRRAMIPALTRLGDFAGAIDQYIEVINRYPEDEGVLREAAVYAMEHGLQQKLVAFYTQTANNSPRDYRWPMVLARLYTSFENFPEAISAYSRATQIRPDRVDLHAARASLEERLLRFDDAANDYARIYELAYHNPEWMEKLAQTRARQGQTDATVRALEKALIEGRPDRPEQYFQVAQRLEQWGMLAPARQFCERALKAVPDSDLADADYAPGLQVYARVMTRLRDYPTAFGKLRAGIPSVTAQPHNIPYTIQQEFQQIAQTARDYFTPEEKRSLVQFLQQQKTGMAQADFLAVLLPFVRQAGLAELEANWLVEAMTRSGAPNNPWETNLVNLQTRRLMFKELGGQLEAFWQLLPPSTGKPLVMDQAVTAYLRAADDADALRVLSAANAVSQRYLELVLAANPQRLVDIAGNRQGYSGDIRTLAAQYAVTNGGGKLALSAVQARGNGLPPVWTRAYTALAGLYYADPTAPIAAAFTDALGSQKIGDRIGHPVDRNLQLAGDVWFYYGSRYGEYLDVTRRPNSEDYLPADVELHPARPSAYFQLAEYYRERGALPLAIAEYSHAIELNSLDGKARDRMAGVLWQQGKKDQAIAQWRQALEAFAAVQDRSHAPETFWTDVKETLESIGNHKVLPDTRAAADKLLRTYIARNGSYRVDPLLEGAYLAAGDPAAGVAWLIELAKAAKNPPELLNAILGAKYIPENQKEPIINQEIAYFKDRAANTYGQEQAAMQAELQRLEIRRLEWLVQQKQTQQAAAALAALPQEVRELNPLVRELEMLVAAQSGTLDALLDRYRRNPDKAPGAQIMQQAAASLRRDGDAANARKLLEFVYTRALETQDFAPANFLGLAEIRLDTGKQDEALRLLHRMTLVAGEPFETQVSAAELLAKSGRHAEAADFLAERVRAVPWDAKARLRLAEEQIAGGKDRANALNSLAALGAQKEAAYDVRASAAELLGSNKGRAPALGSAELDLLARGQPVDPAAAEQPLFYRARLAAAGQSKDPGVQVRLLSSAIAIDPDAPATVRVSLEHAAVQSGRNRLAVGVMIPVLESSGLAYRMRRFESEQAEGNQTAVEEMDQPRSYEAARFLAESGLAPAARAAAAQDLAAAHEKLGELREAADFYAIAIELEPSATTRAALKKSADTVGRQLEVRAANIKRQPVLSENLEQPGVVRPRVRP